MLPFGIVHDVPEPIGVKSSIMSPTPHMEDVGESSEAVPLRKPHRHWRAKFGDAFRGLKLGVRGHSSFSVHFFFAALVIAAAIVFRCDATEWSLLLGCIGIVLTAELFNSALETLFHAMDAETKNRAHPCLDIAAGAVLTASIAAAIVGLIVFLPRLWAMLVDLRG
jgi:diacylglycerol kinase